MPKPSITKCSRPGSSAAMLASASSSPSIWSTRSRICAVHCGRRNYSRRDARAQRSEKNPDDAPFLGTIIYSISYTIVTAGSPMRQTLRLTCPFVLALLLSAPAALLAQTATNEADRRLKTLYDTEWEGRAEGETRGAG